MKAQIIRQNVTLENVDIKYPIFSMIEEEFETFYIKIEKNWFHQIKIGFSNIEIWSRKGENIQISEMWYNNQCDEKEWIHAVSSINKLVASFCTSQIEKH